jgi:hypothetical protein
MDGHVKLLAILYIVFGGLGVLLALVVLLVFGSIAGLVAAVVEDQLGARFAPQIISAVGSLVFVFILILSVPNIAAGVGLLSYREWGRILTIILSALNLPFVPFGTVLGVYGLWVLLNNQTIALFRRPASLAPRA